MCVYTYIYIYIYTYTYIYIYTYIHIHMYTGLQGTKSGAEEQFLLLDCKTCDMRRHTISYYYY